MINLYPLARPILSALSAETAHNLTIFGLKSGLGPSSKQKDDPCLSTQVFGLKLPNPVGLAAGFDKNADVSNAMLNVGFGFVEAGTVTPKPQAGNDKPRLFRLVEDKAVINRFGFNNKGLEYFTARLKNRRPGGIVGANVGANKDATDRTEDYVTGIMALYGLSDYFTVNISSPNTPGLRALQSRDSLNDLVTRVLAARQAKMDAGMQRIPILVKIAPDLTEEDIKDIAAVALDNALDGLIVSNTTITRPSTLTSAHKSEIGGLSGAPLKKLSTDTLAQIYRATGGKITLIGVGGISSGADAFDKIAHGASLVQLYSALAYDGPSLVADIKTELTEILKEKGFASVSDAVGSAVKL
ncbi:dihydroorotate dehydrogenase (quinone) [Kordiimonas sediminis]|uniref:Dihydroorotate dehydrogenase (quinone) n=1 Tax=Kordiimonas sediminis TaxID=1735581 RepID=A0A919APH9_9PROT|nr:quinone-dependent dihydroorotate dehydrogenase [Kordiimonas sediminis]GHF15769.1 dihydroorotate dehydrogenase (quinone) [Kordiimonas sediminis]